jgi:hypothetical protein
MGVKHQIQDTLVADSCLEYVGSCREKQGEGGIVGLSDVQSTAPLIRKILNVSAVWEVSTISSISIIN